MNALHAAVHGWLEAWGFIILDYVAFATVLAGATVFATGRVRRAKASSREILLLTAIFIMAIPIPLILGSWGFTGRDLFASLFRTEGPAVEITGMVSSETALPAVAEARSETACALGAIWLAGFVAMAAVWADRAIRARRLLRNTHPGSRRDREILARVVARSGIRAFVDVARIETLHVPCVSGTLRPCIYLPTGTVDRLSDEELETIFAHELAHIRRGDNRVAAAVDLARAVLWFQPVAWIAARQLEIERERACDEAALEIGISSEHYLSAFTQICNHALVSEAGVSCMSTSGLAQRMEDVMTWEARKSQFVAARWFTIAALSFVAIAFAAGWLIAPAAAAEETGGFTLTGTVMPKDNTVICTMEVRDPAGAVISAPKVTVQKGQKAEVRSDVQSDDGSERDIRIEILVDVAGAAVAFMEVRENGTVVQTSETSLRPVVAAAGGDAPPKIDLKLKDASLSDVVATFGKLTGFAIIL
ncbi:MAG: M56 family metallopeptidase, partial [Thermoanaerobaculia bacterium]